MAVGAKLLYVLPGFDVLAVELCHVQVKGSSKMEKPEDTFDLFVRNDFSMSRTYPGEMSLKEVMTINSVCLLFTVHSTKENHVCHYTFVSCRRKTSNWE